MCIKILLADDLMLVREAICMLLKMNREVEVIGEAGSGEECIQKMYQLHPDLLILDIGMCEKDGFDILAEMKENNVNVKVLILTAHKELNYLLKAIEEFHVEGYLLKSSKSSELIHAVRSITKGDRYIQAEVKEILASSLKMSSSDDDKLNSLTKREKEVLIQVAKGMFNREIAITLNISERTVKNHISSIFRKIEVSDRTQAAVFAYKNSMICLF